MADWYDKNLGKSKQAFSPAASGHTVVPPQSVEKEAAKTKSQPPTLHREPLRLRRGGVSSQVTVPRAVTTPVKQPDPAPTTLRAKFKERARDIERDR